MGDSVREGSRDFATRVKWYNSKGLPRREGTAAAVTSTDPLGSSMESFSASYPDRRLLRPAVGLWSQDEAKRNDAWSPADDAHLDEQGLRADSPVETNRVFSVPSTTTGVRPVAPL